MKVSLITVSFNSNATLRDTIESVRSQTYPELEHILIDGGSTDGTLELIQEYEHHFAYLCSEPDRGIYDAMNKGLAQCSGDIIGILNSDDFYRHPQVIEQVVRCFQAHQTDTVYGDLEYVAPNNPEQVQRIWKAGPYRREAFLYGWMPPHPSFFVRRELYERYGNFSLELRSSADYELMLRFLYKHGASAAYLPEVLVRMRSGGMSNQSWKHRLRANREDRKAWRLNGIRPPFYTTLLKPFRKLGQFFP
jgi:glycosyltransferase involved in cell wall biosynthesis